MIPACCHRHLQVLHERHAHLGENGADIAARVGVRNRALAADVLACLVVRVERLVVDLLALMGYYGLVSMALNVDRYPLPDGAKPELAPLQ